MVLARGIRKVSTRMNVIEQRMHEEMCILPQFWTGIGTISAE